LKDNQELWKDRLNTKVNCISGNKLFIAIGCVNGDVYIYNPTGRRILPCMILGPSPVARVHCEKNGKRVMVISCDGKLNLWDISSRCHLIKTNLKPLTDSLSQGGLISAEINDQGQIIIITGSSEAFLFDTSLNSFSVSLINATPTQNILPLYSIIGILKEALYKLFNYVLPLITLTLLPILFTIWTKTSIQFHISKTKWPFV